MSRGLGDVYKRQEQNLFNSYDFKIRFDINIGNAIPIKTFNISVLMLKDTPFAHDFVDVFIFQNTDSHLSREFETFHHRSTTAYVYSYNATWDRSLLWRNRQF